MTDRSGERALAERALPSQRLPTAEQPAGAPDATASLDRTLGTIRFEDLNSFLVLGEELHFARAAGRLHLTPSALSRRIAGLERQLGALLVDRSMRPIELTQRGAHVAAIARRVLAEFQVFTR